MKEELHYNFYHKGNNVEIQVFDQSQFDYKKYITRPKKVEIANIIISPIPGIIVSVFVKEGQVVTDGQELMIIEAMKMQNIIKAKIDEKVKKIHVKPG